MNVVAKGPGNACNQCGGEGTFRCSACQQVSYCCQTHQKMDWKKHKPACLYYRKDKTAAGSLDSVVPKNEYVGTLRWGPNTVFKKLPEFRKGMIPPLTGWRDYFGVRLEGSGPENDDGKLVLEPPLIDGLSFPLTFLWAVRSLLTTKSISMDLIRRQTVVIAALGASERAEERILAESNYWAEIGNTFPSSQVELWLVGPEMSTSRHNKTERLTANMTVTCLRGTTGSFLDQCREKDPILAGFNTGFGSGDDRLRASWMVDLGRILKLGLLSIFTCANDHSDLKGEREVMEKTLKAKYILYPRRSPFSAVTTTHAPGRQDDTWACANSFVYAVQGSAVDCDAGRRQRGTAKTRGTDGALIGNAAADSKPGNTSFGGKTANPPVKVIAEEAEAEYDMEELD